jgi:hypothetical protein
LNGDGKLDLIGGNHGLNSRFHATPKQPVELWVGDFDHNGTTSGVLTTYENGKGPYPLALYQNIIKQIPYLRSKYPTFSSYAGKTINDIFTQKQLHNTIHYKAGEFASVIGWNKGNGSFRIDSLPFRAQLAPIYSILAGDLDGDNIPEIYLGGNLSSVKPQTGPYMASYGIVLHQDSTGTYRGIPTSKSGFFVRGEIRSIKSLYSQGKELMFVARNNKRLKIFKIRHCFLMK